MEVSFGIYWRISSLRFSFDPRSQLFLATLVKGSVISGGAEDEAAFDDIGKDEEALSVLGEIQSFGIGAVELVEGGA